MNSSPSRRHPCLHREWAGLGWGYREGPCCCPYLSWRRMRHERGTSFFGFFGISKVVQRKLRSLLTSLRLTHTCNDFSCMMNELLLSNQNCCEWRCLAVFVLSVEWISSVGFVSNCLGRITGHRFTTRNQLKHEKESQASQLHFSK
jgi:hypothetical protein